MKPEPLPKTLEQIALFRAIEATDYSVHRGYEGGPLKWESTLLEARAVAEDLSALPTRISNSRFYSQIEIRIMMFCHVVSIAHSTQVDDFLSMSSSTTVVPIALYK